MFNKKPFKTEKYKLSLIDQKAFIIIRLSDKKQSNVYRGSSGDANYEIFEYSFYKPEIFDDICDQEFAKLPAEDLTQEDIMNNFCTDKTEQDV